MVSRKPDWLKVKLPKGGSAAYTEKVISKLLIHTVCQEANCPNRMECFGQKTAAFMIMGNTCTRNCTFCNISKGIPETLDPNEPAHVALAAAEMKLKYVVITSVTRDDLSDGGASHFIQTMQKIREKSGDILTELLIPDLQGNWDALKKIIEAAPDVINHNVETVPRLYPLVRPKAIYKRSLELIAKTKTIRPNILTKSGIMVGLGEKEAEIIEVLKDLRNSGCDLVTIGQYLAPSSHHYPIQEYITPEIFEKYKKAALQFGFRDAACGPLVRSSYHAEKLASFAE
jgi:lipoic acid synthetase